MQWQQTPTEINDHHPTTLNNRQANIRHLIDRLNADKDIEK